MYLLMYLLFAYIGGTVAADKRAVAGMERTHEVVIHANPPPPHVLLSRHPVFYLGLGRGWGQRSGGGVLRQPEANREKYEEYRAGTGAYQMVSQTQPAGFFWRPSFRSMIVRPCLP